MMESPANTTDLPFKHVDALAGLYCCSMHPSGCQFARVFGLDRPSSSHSPSLSNALHLYLSLASVKLFWQQRQEYVQYMYKAGSYDRSCIDQINRSERASVHSPVTKKRKIASEKAIPIRMQWKAGRALPIQVNLASDFLPGATLAGFSELMLAVVVFSGCHLPTGSSSIHTSKKHPGSKKAKASSAMCRSLDQPGRVVLWCMYRELRSCRDAAAAATRLSK